MKSKFIGLFCFVFLFSSVSWAEVGSSTYQRVKAANAPENAEGVQPQVQTETKSKGKKKKKSDAAEDIGRGLTIGEDLELTFPAGLSECRVYDSNSLQKAILRAVWKGECEWIVMRPPSDWDPNDPLWLQLDKPIVIEDKHPNAVGHPVVISNDTGRAIIFKAPKNNGCSLIIRKPNVAILGITFEGAVCH